jgi:hypothetical protein
MAGKKYLSKINKEGNDLFIKDEESQDALFFKDVYIGAAAQSTTIKTSTYHHDILVKGSLVSITANSQKIWLIFPEDIDVPNIFMSGMEVAMVLHGTTTIDEATYKVYKSDSPFTGTFNIQLF